MVGNTVTVIVVKVAVEHVVHNEVALEFCVLFRLFRSLVVHVFTIKRVLRCLCDYVGNDVSEKQAHASCQTHERNKNFDGLRSYAMLALLSFDDENDGHEHETENSCENRADKRPHSVVRQKFVALNAEHERYDDYRKICEQIENDRSHRVDDRRLELFIFGAVADGERRNAGFVRFRRITVEFRFFDYLFFDCRFVFDCLNVCEMFLTHITAPPYPYFLAQARLRLLWERPSPVRIENRRRFLSFRFRTSLFRRFARLFWLSLHALYVL